MKVKIETEDGKVHYYNKVVDLETPDEGSTAGFFVVHMRHAKAFIRAHDVVILETEEYAGD